MRYAALLGLLPFAGLFAQPAPALPTGSFIVEHVRVFDGQSFTEDRSVEVRDGKILSLEVERKAKEMPKVDGRGLTLLPGLIDAHTHVYGSALKQALAFGVTTELDMFSAIASSMKIKEAEQKGEWKDGAALFTAGTLATVPGGHGTEYGMTIPTLTRPEEAQAFVDARIAEGSDYIKIVYDDGHAYGRKTPTLDNATLRALVAAAHQRGKLAVVHVMSLQEAGEVLDAGADGLAHLFMDHPGDTAFAKKAQEHHAFVIPTLSVLQAFSGGTSGAALMTEPRTKSFLGPNEIANLQKHFTIPASLSDYHFAEKTISALLAAGVPILAGTDAPNPGTAHGVSLHGELELLVAAGLTPAQALAAATSVPADHFQLHDRGRIAPGYRADLLLVRGDPGQSIRNTRDIVAVWKAGIPFDRDAYQKEIGLAQAKVQESSTPPSGLGDGRIADFDTGELSARFGAGWIKSEDSIAGGKSTVELKVVAGGAEGTSHALSITGNISPALGYAWAGAMFSPGPQPLQPVDLSQMRAIDFWTKGDGKTYRLMVFTQAHGPMPLITTFPTTADWTEVTIPFTKFGTEGKDVTALLFSGGPQPEGAFAFEVDSVKLIK